MTMKICISIFTNFLQQFLIINSTHKFNAWISINVGASLNVSGSGFTLSFANGQLSFQMDD